MSDFDRTPPNDIGAEQCAIGGMLLSRAAIDEVGAILIPGDHYRPAHQIIHEAILRLHNAGEPADVITLAGELTRTGELAKVGGAPYLHTLIAAVPTAANAAYYARIVRERSLMRGLIEAGTRAVQAGFSADGTAEELTARIRSDLDALGGTGDAPAGITSAEAFTDALRRMENPQEIRDMVTLPYADLRELLPVLRPGQLITVGARPGAGKSLFATDAVRHIGLKLRKRVAFFTMEMSQAEVMDRMVAAEASVLLPHVQTGGLDDRDWHRVAAVSDTFGEGRFVIDDTPKVALSHVRAFLRRMALEDPARIAVVDYLQLMKPEERFESREREVASFAAGLKHIAREFAIPVLLLAQLNRASDQRPDRRPVKSDFRESGAIENESDVVILIHRPEMHDPESERVGEADLIVDKNRAGPMGVATVLFQGHYGRFANMSWTATEFGRGRAA